MHEKCPHSSNRSRLLLLGLRSIALENKDKSRAKIILYLPHRFNRKYFIHSKIHETKYLQLCSDDIIYERMI